MTDESPDPETPVKVEDVSEGLQLERTTFSAGENRPVNAHARFRMFDTPAMGLAPKIGTLDDSDITKIITEWESLHPDDVLRRINVLATQPYSAIGTDFAILVTDETIRQWFESKDFLDGMLDFPISNPRKVKVSNLQITYLGRSRACATYRVEEEHTNGRVSAGNSAAFLAKTDGGWKIVSTAQHPNFTDDLAPKSRPTP